MSDMLREFQIFAKPVGPGCNLRCNYCYYLDKKKLYPGKEKLRMSEEILEEYIKQHIQASGDDNIFFSWHGGEPLLAGLDFFRKAVELQKRHKPGGSTIINGIQTNGTLIDRDWCKFLASEKFIVGVSIDGTEELHNKFRRTRENAGTFQEVIKGYELLKSYGITPEILCVVSSANVEFPVAIYNFFRQLGAKYMTFLPLVERDPDSPDGVSRNTVRSTDFGIFLSEIFDEWVEKDIGTIKVQIFEEAARTAFNQEHTLCIFKMNCGGVPVVEHNGDVFSCDHYADKDHYLGNLKDHPLSYYLDCEQQKAFGSVKSETLPGYCTRCALKPMCNGECPKNRFLKTSDGEEGLNYLCSGYKYFFNHCQPFVQAIREAWMNQGG